jgi:hypothetical protein
MLLRCPRRVQVTQSHPGQTKVTQRALWPNYELGEARVRLDKANSVSDKANGISQLASGWLRVTRAILRHYRPKVILGQGGRPMRKSSGEAS